MQKLLFLIFIIMIIICLFSCAKKLNHNMSINQDRYIELDENENIIYERIERDNFYLIAFFENNNLTQFKINSNDLEIVMNTENNKIHSFAIIKDGIYEIRTNFKENGILLNRSEKIYENEFIYTFDNKGKIIIE